MKFFSWVSIFLVLISLIVLVPVVAQASTTMDSKETGVQVILDRGKLADTEGDEDKPTVYTPKKASPVKVLPSTGEVVTSFIYIIIGLSFVLFILGIVISRLGHDNVRWEYL